MRLISTRIERRSVSSEPAMPSLIKKNRSNVTPLHLLTNLINKVNIVLLETAIFLRSDLFFFQPCNALNVACASICSHIQNIDVIERKINLILKVFIYFKDK